MATIKKPIAKKVMSMMKKNSAPKKAAAGYTTSAETTKKPLSDKDSMNIYANRYDKFSAEAVKNLGNSKGKGLLKKADEARTNENRLAKKIYGTTPSNKKGGVVKKSMKKGGKMSKKK